MQRIPNRTLFLMIVALVAFARFWCATHPSPPAEVSPKGHERSR